MNYIFRTLKGILGQSGEVNTETKGLLLTYKIEEEPYPTNIDKYFPPPFSIDEELKLRNDFRYFECLHKCTIQLQRNFFLEKIVFSPLILLLPKIWTMHFLVYCYQMETTKSVFIYLMYLILLSIIHHLIK